MNITRLLTILLIGSIMLIATGAESQAQRAARNTSVTPPPPAPVNEETTSPR